MIRRAFTRQRRMSLYRIGRNILSNYALLAVAGLINFILTPLLFRHLQPQSYALLMLATAIAGLLESLNLGLASTLVRSVSELATLDQNKDLKRLVSSAFYLLAGVGIVGAIALAALSPALTNFFSIQGELARSGQVAIGLFGLSAAFQLPTSALRALLHGQQDFHLANAVDICGHLMLAAGTLLLIQAGAGLLPIVTLFPATAFLRLVGMLLASRWTRVPFWPSWTAWDAAMLRKIRNFANLAFLDDTVTRLYTQADSFLAAKLLPLPELAVLAVARRIPGALTRLAQQALWVAYPIVSSAAAREDRKAIERFTLISIRNLLAVSLPLSIAMFVWAGVILRLWVGEGVLSGVPVFRAFLLFAVFASLQESPLTVLYGLGRIRFSAGVSVAMLASSIGFGAAASRHYGLLGLAVAFAGVQTVGTLLRLWQALRLTQLDARRWLKKAVAPVVVAALPGGAWFLVAYKLVPHSLMGLALSAVAGLALFLAVFTRLATGSKPQTWQSRIRTLLREIS